MAEEYSRTDIVTIADGAIPELFEAELRKVMANIDDLNTDAKAKRSLTVELTFRPDASRQSCEVGLSVKSKLANAKKHESVVFVVRDGKGDLFAVNNNVHQPELFKG